MNTKMPRIRLTILTILLIALESACAPATPSTADAQNTPSDIDTASDASSADVADTSDTITALSSGDADKAVDGSAGTVERVIAADASASAAFKLPMTSLTTWTDTNYGYCGEEYYFKGKCHIGSDLMAAVGTPVFPIGNGKIVQISGKANPECSSGWGSTTIAGVIVCNSAVIVSHQLAGAGGPMFYVIYGHLQTDTSWFVGQSVSADLALGAIGNWPNGAHLHLGVFPGALPVTELGMTPCTESGTVIPPTCSANGTVAPMAFIKSQL